MNATLSRLQSPLVDFIDIFMKCLPDMEISVVLSQEYVPDAVNKSCFL